MLLKKIFSTVVIIGFLVPIVAGSDSTGHKQEKKKKLSEQTHCPVMPVRKINKELFVDHQGQRIYVCCRGCIDQVKKNPEKKGQSVEVIQSFSPQKTCPVMGGVVNRDLFVDFKGKRVYVCCSGCIADVQKDPESYLKKLANMGEKPEMVSIEK